MTTFLHFQDADTPLVRDYFSGQTYGTCDYTVGAVYQWRNIYHPYLSIADGTLCLRATFWEYGEAYMVPIGTGDLDKAFARIEADAKERELPLCYVVVPESALPLLRARYGNRMHGENIRNWADYLYDAEAFRTYRGKALHTQKNHTNRFYKEHPTAKVIRVEDESTERMALDFLDRFAAQADFSDETERDEWQGTKDMVKARALTGQTVGCLHTEEDGIVALAVGEVQNGTLFVHAEKALYRVSGAYATMAQGFVSLFPDVTEVNREEDGGDEGLRQSKLRYRPKELRAKYFVTVEASDEGTERANP